MREELLEILRCSESGQRLKLQGDSLVSEGGGTRYPIRNGIPRFVPESNYADNFGMQWNIFAKTQLDSHSGHPISSNRFWKATGWNPADMRGKWVLDAGCGSGRFAEIALSTGARVVALDYSSAVEACWANLKHHPNLHVVQGDIYALPFAKESFDFVYSLGVLQHTPDVGKAFASLPPMLQRGGRLGVDYYEKSWKQIAHPKYWLRPFAKNLDQDRLFKLLKKTAPALLKASRVCARVPLVGGILKRAVPVANYEGIYPLSPSQLEEWAVLDTFDWLSPAYDKPQTVQTIHQWLKMANLRQLEVLKAGHLVARGTKA